MTHWTKLWIAWASVLVIGFFAIEMPAVFNDETGDTLTEHVVEYIPGEALVAGWGGLAVWLTVHFAVRYARKGKSED